MRKCKYCGKEFKAFNPKTEFKERWHVDKWMACYDVGTREMARRRVEQAQAQQSLFG